MNVFLFGPPCNFWVGMDISRVPCAKDHAQSRKVSATAQAELSCMTPTLKAPQFFNQCPDMFCLFHHWFQLTFGFPAACFLSFFDFLRFPLSTFRGIFPHLRPLDFLILSHVQNHFAICDDNFHLPFQPSCPISRKPRPQSFFGRGSALAKENKDRAKAGTVHICYKTYKLWKNV